MSSLKQPSARSRCALVTFAHSLAAVSRPSDLATESPIATTNIGVAAHICAASRNGPRYIESMTPQQRSEIGNAIWLCSNHAALIDRDVATYTIDRLHQMKQAHEAACVESVRRAMQESRLADDLVALGPNVICTGELLAVDASAWSIQVRHFVAGRICDARLIY